ncbi:hypothetical protein ACNSPD_03390 [Yersinia enterocolitica]
MIYVNFTDSDQTTIDSIFAGPQSPNEFDNLAEIDVRDSRYADYYNNLPLMGREGVAVPE